MLLEFGLKLPNPAAAAPPLVLLPIPPPAGVAALPKAGLVVEKALLPAPLVLVLDAVEDGVAVLPKGGELLGKALLAAGVDGVGVVAPMP